MFPVKWIDDMYDKFESVRSNVDETISEEFMKCVEGLQNVGTTVKQFCSSEDPLKYVEDGLLTVGVKIEQLYSSVVPSSMDSVLLPIDDILSKQNSDVTPCKASESNDHEDHDDNNCEPLMSDESKTSSGTYIRSSNPDNIFTKEGENLDTKPEEPGVTSSDVTGSYDNYSGESATNSTEPCADEHPDPGCSPPGHKTDSSLLEINDKSGHSSAKEMDAYEKTYLNPAKVKLGDDCVLVDKNDYFVFEIMSDDKSHKENIRQPKTSRLGFIPRSVYPQERKKRAAASLEMEGSLALPEISTNSDCTSDSDWEII